VALLPVSGARPTRKTPRGYHTPGFPLAPMARSALGGLAAFEGGVRQVLGPQGIGGIFVIYPQACLSTFPRGFVDQVV